MDPKEEMGRFKKSQMACRIQKDCKDEVCQTKIINSKDPEKSKIRIAVFLMSNICLTLDVERKVTAQTIISMIQSEPELGLMRQPPVSGSQPVFALWLCSSQLDVQLQSTHKPIELAKKWSSLVSKYGSPGINGSDEEPLLYFRRNVFLSRREEEQIKELKILELLYAEAKKNVLEGRYPCEGQARYASLGALQARIELGPYSAQTHTLSFFRKHRGKFLPHQYNSPSLLLGLGFDLGLVGGKGAPEARLLEQYKRIPNNTGGNANSRKLVRKYLEFCWGLPCYGAAFFKGQIERPVRGLASWITNCDLQVLIAINTIGVYIVDDTQCSLLLGLRYSELNWEMAKPSDEENPDCLPCLFLQFPVRENGIRVYKILQIFSKQASMMDSLISVFAEESNKVDPCDESLSNNNQLSENSMVFNIASFTNKLSKLTLATFDEDGHCIGQMGSWSIQ